MTEVQFLGRGSDGIFSPRHQIQTTQPPIQWIPRALTLGVKQPGQEDDHSSPSSPKILLASWCFIKQEIHFDGMVLSHVQDNSSFT